MIESIKLLIGCACVFWLVFSQCHNAFRWLESVTKRTCGDLLERCGEVELPEAHYRLMIQCWLVLMPGVIFYIATVLYQIPFAVVACLLAIVTPRILLKLMIEKQEKTIRSQMVSASNFLVNTARAGMPITDGFRCAVEELPAPVSQVFNRIVSDVRYGRVLSESIDGVKKKLSLECFTLFSTAIQVALTQGGNMTNSLTRITHSLEEHDRLEGKMQAETADSRRANLLMACAPVLWFGFLYFAMPTWFDLMFSGLVGQAITSTIFLLVFYGYRSAENVLKLEV